MLMWWAELISVLFFGLMMAGYPCCCAGATCFKIDGEFGPTGSVQIEIQGLVSAGTCDNCEALNATWILDRQADGVSADPAVVECCYWQICDIADIDISGAWGGAAFCNHTFLKMKVCEWNDGTQHYQMSISLETWSSAINCQGDLVASYFGPDTTTMPTVADIEGTKTATPGLPYCDSSAVSFIVTFV